MQDRGFEMACWVTLNDSANFSCIWHESSASNASNSEFSKHVLWRWVQNRQCPADININVRRVSYLDARASYCQLSRIFEAFTFRHFGNSEYAKWLTIIIVSIMKNSINYIQPFCFFWIIKTTECESHENSRQLAIRCTRIQVRRTSDAR